MVQCAVADDVKDTIQSTLALVIEAMKHAPNDPELQTLGHDILFMLKMLPEQEGQVYGCFCLECFTVVDVWDPEAAGRMTEKVTAHAKVCAMELSVCMCSRWLLPL